MSEEARKKIRKFLHKAGEPSEWVEEQAAAGRLYRAGVLTGDGESVKVAKQKWRQTGLSEQDIVEETKIQRDTIRQEREGSS